MLYAIRLSFPYAEVEEFFKKFKDSVVVYEHEADEEVNRTHVHALVETAVSTDSMKNWVTKSLGKRPNKTDWAFVSKIQKEPVTYRFITYMTKGVLDPMYIHHITLAECEEYKNKWVRHEKREDKKLSVRQVTNLDIAIELKEFIMNEVWDGQEYDPGRIPMVEKNNRWIVNKCIDLHNKYGKTYMIHSLIRVVHTAWGLCQNGTKWRERLIEATIKQINIDN